MALLVPADNPTENWNGHTSGNPIDILTHMMSEKTGKRVEYMYRPEKLSFLIDVQMEDLGGQPGSIQIEVSMEDLPMIAETWKLEALALGLLKQMNLLPKKKAEKESKLTKKQQEVADRWLI